MLTIKRVKKTSFYDIFMGNGWSTHSRILLQGKHAKLISGVPLTKIQLVEVVKTIGA